MNTTASSYRFQVTSDRSWSCGKQNFLRLIVVEVAVDSSPSAAAAAAAVPSFAGILSMPDTFGKVMLLIRAQVGLGVEC